MGLGDGDEVCGNVTTTLAAVVVPNLTVVFPGMKPVPVIATELPPAVVPTSGTKLVTVGGVTNVKFTLEVAVPPGVVTGTETVPAGLALVTTVIFVVLVTRTVVSFFVPKCTVVAPVTKPLPVIVTVVWPKVGPSVGVILVMVGTTS